GKRVNLDFPAEFLGEELGNLTNDINHQLEQANDAIGLIGLGVCDLRGHLGRESSLAQCDQHLVNLLRGEIRGLVDTARDGFHRTPPEIKVKGTYRPLWPDKLSIILINTSVNRSHHKARSAKFLL
ncbi:MAG: hypothetical protein AAB863_02460, partial [Patescibacteria group bacterium]